MASSFVLTLDTTGPVISLSAPSEVGTGTTFNIVISSNEPILSGQSIAVTDNQGTTHTFPIESTANGYQCAVTTSGMALGMATASARLTDVVGNLSNTATVSFSIYQLVTESIDITTQIVTSVQQAAQVTTSVSETTSVVTQMDQTMQMVTKQSFDTSIVTEVSNATEVGWVNQLVQNDYGIALNFTINDETGYPRNLTNDTVTLTIKRPNSTMTQTCTVTNATQGQCQYVLQNGDLSEYGTYFLSVQASGTGYQYTSTTYMNLVVRAQ